VPSSNEIKRYPEVTMDFTDQVKALAARMPGLMDSILTEEATKQYLIIPFIQALGYDVFDPREVFPEFDANVGASKKYKLDYAILQEGKPIILIECKWRGDTLTEGYSQLFHYFSATNARIGVLTNGIIYRFYADLDRPNKMDDKPFLEIDMLNLKESLVDELKKITKSAFNLDEMVSAATELKYVGGILGILTEQLSSPSEDLTKFFFSQSCPGKVFSPTAKAQFADYTKRALKQFIRDQLSHILDASGFTASVSPAIDVSNTEASSISDDSQSKVVTTEEELEGYYIVKSVLREVIDPSRIAYRDVQSYFGILLDNNNRKPVCRLHFNNSNAKRIGLFGQGDDEKQEEKFPIENLNDIYKYAEQLRITVQRYDASLSGG
jgi:predicted type IV restriction endonuclease